MLLPDAGHFLALVLLGGWVAADATSLGQFMVSRPLVAATLAGLVVGNPVAGAALGLTLEAFHLTVLPVGAARYPEPGPAAVASASAFAVWPGSAGTLLTVVVFALVWEWVSGESVQLMRRLNSRLAAGADRFREPDRVLERLHLLAVGIDVARGMLLTALGIVAIHALLGVVGEVGPGGELMARAALGAAIAALLAGAYRLFGSRAGLFAAGLGAGLLLVLLRS